MSTLRDVGRRIGEINGIVRLFGCSAEFSEEFLKRTLEIGSAVCREQGIKPEQGATLPMETVLGQESENSFQSLQCWLKDTLNPTGVPPR
jgi:hypothetical protein